MEVKSERFYFNDRELTESFDALSLGPRCKPKSPISLQFSISLQEMQGKASTDRQPTSSSVTPYGGLPLPGVPPLSLQNLRFLRKALKKSEIAFVHSYPSEDIPYILQCFLVMKRFLNRLKSEMRRSGKDQRDNARRTKSFPSSNPGKKCLQKPEVRLDIHVDEGCGFVSAGNIIHRNVPCPWCIPPRIPLLPNECYLYCKKHEELRGVGIHAEELDLELISEAMNHIN